MDHFKQINFVLVCTSCLLATLRNKQRLNVRIGHLEIGLDRGFVKRCLNFASIIDRKGLTMLFLVTVIPILVSELPSKTIECKGIIFYAANKASEWFVSSAVRVLLLCSRNIPL